MFTFILLILIGALAGILSGLLGIGGGLIIVPALSYFFKYTHYQYVSKDVVMQTSVATSLLAIALTVSASVFAHQRCSSIRWDIWRRWVPGLCVGSLMATQLISILSTEKLGFFFALFLIVMATKFFMEKTILQTAIPARRLLLVLIGCCIGLLSGLFGVGGGILMVPVLICLGCSISESAGTSSASMLPLALVAGVSYVIMGLKHPGANAWVTGYVYWPGVLIFGILGIFFAPLGVKLSHKLSMRLGKRLLAVLLFVVAIDMLV